MKFTLTDTGDENNSLHGEVEIAPNKCLEIKLDGYGDFYSNPGYGIPIYLELIHGKPTLYVWADINHQEPTHVIDLSNAKEELYRKE